MTRKTASLSVKMPTSFSLSTTITAPTRALAISCAASLTLVCEEVVTIFSSSIMFLMRTLNIAASRWQAGTR